MSAMKIFFLLSLGIVMSGWSLTIDCFPLDLNDNSTACLLGIPRSGVSAAAEIVCDGTVVQVGHPSSYDDKYQLITSLNKLLIQNEINAAQCESFEEIYAETICFFNPNRQRILPECSFPSSSSKITVF